MSQPVRGSRAAQPGGDEHAEAGDDREAEQPPGLVAEARLQQAEHAGGAAERAATATAATDRVRRRARRSGR